MAHIESVYFESPWEKAPGDEDDYAFIFTSAIGTRTIASVDSITVTREDGEEWVSGTDLTFGNGSPNDAQFDDEYDDPVAVGKAAQALGNKGVAGVDYKVVVLVTLSDGRKKAGIGFFHVRG